MEPIIILQGISVDQLLACISSALEQKINEKLEKIQNKPPVRYLSRKEVACQLQISLPTLNDWTKLGWLKSYKIGTRVLYKSDEITQALKERKFRRI